MDADEDTDRNVFFAYLRWFRETDETGIVFIRELGGSIAMVLVVGMVLFAVSGVWPPMVAVESGSMEPEMYRGDLIFIMEEHRLAPDVAYEQTGVVTYQMGSETGYSEFKSYGDVIVFQPDGDPARTPIIHRARFWVNDSENWYAKANPDYITGDSCDEIPQCPAPHAGFITKGDANMYYDQIKGFSGPVRPRWVIGTAEIKIPYLGEIRLALA